jgi:hypothetical protein
MHLVFALQAHVLRSVALDDDLDIGRQLRLESKLAIRLKPDQHSKTVLITVSAGLSILRPIEARIGCQPASAAD